MAYKSTESITFKVRALIGVREFLKAPDIPPKMLACQRSLTKYTHRDLVDDIGQAEAVLTMPKLRYDPRGRTISRLKA